MYLPSDTRERMAQVKTMRNLIETFFPWVYATCRKLAGHNEEVHAVSERVEVQVRAGHTVKEGDVVAIKRIPELLTARASGTIERHERAIIVRHPVWGVQDSITLRSDIRPLVETGKVVNVGDAIAERDVAMNVEAKHGGVVRLRPNELVVTWREDISKTVPATEKIASPDILSPQTFDQLLLSMASISVRRALRESFDALFFMRDERTLVAAHTSMAGTDQLMDWLRAPTSTESQHLNTEIEERFAEAMTFIRSLAEKAWRMPDRFVAERIPASRTELRRQLLLVNAIPQFQNTLAALMRVDTVFVLPDILGVANFTARGRLRKLTAEKEQIAILNAD